MVRWLVGLGGGGDDDDVNRKCHPPPPETRGVKNEEELLSGQKTGSPSLPRTLVLHPREEIASVAGWTTKADGHILVR